MKVGVIINREKEKACKVAERIIHWFSSHHLPIYVAREDGPQAVKGGLVVRKDEMAREMDILIVLGGDGTFLNAARFFAGSRIPIIGFNIGRMGFLTEMDIGNLDEILETLLQGRYRVEERMMLEGRVLRKGQEITRVLGLNDVVVSKGAFARIIELTLKIHQETVTTYPGDGLIVATPTGSTAYSLSAGGPIIEPSVKSLLITPICPHTLYARSLVVQDSEEVEIEVKRADRRAMLTVDGQEGVRLSRGDKVLLTSAPEKTCLIRLEGTTFYEILRNRFNYKSL